MAIADATNAYAIKAEADIYFDTRLYSGTWLNADVQDHEKALIQATRILDSYINWHEIPDKTLTIDQAIKDATCELALVLLAGDVQVKDDMEGLDSVSLKGMTVKAKGEKRLIPDHVFRLISHLGTRKGVVSGSLTITRSM